MIEVTGVRRDSTRRNRISSVTSVTTDKGDGKVLIYYGGADTVLCVASYELNELIPKK